MSFCHILVRRNPWIGGHWIIRAEIQEGGRAEIRPNLLPGYGIVKMSENMELTADFIRSIIATGELNGFDWKEFSIVISFDDVGDVSGTYGYAYTSDADWEAFAVNADPIEPAAKAYWQWLINDGDKGMIKMLLQFNRVSKNFNADFEHENLGRWKVTPKNIDTIVEELRPNLW
jgi:hypothetical protein